jgi:hypothetical protein
VRGASALSVLLQTKPDPRLKLLVVWERVLSTDYGFPSRAVLAEINDRRAVQFWDPRRSLSKAMGERSDDSETVVWDWVALYPPGVQWTGQPPQPLFSGRTVEDVATRLSTEMDTALGRKP